MPRLLVDRPQFRIVEGEIGGTIDYLLEVPDGCDGLGVERWRSFKLPSTELRAIFRFMVELALDLEQKNDAAIERSLSREHAKGRGSAAP